MPTKLKPSGVDPVAEFTFDSIATSTVVIGNVAISDSGNGNIQIASIAANGQIGTPSAIAGGGGVTVYNSISELPLTGVDAGAMALVLGSPTRLYVRTDTGWFNVGLINTNPNITSGPDSSYQFAQNGTPTVITLVASDPEGLPIIWSYEVTTGSLGSTATVSQSNNVFTITPSTNASHAGSFSITFIASDGLNIATATSSFTLAFLPTGTLQYTLHNPNNDGGSVADFFGFSLAADSNRLVVGAPFEAGNAGRIYVYDMATQSLLYGIANPNILGGVTTDSIGNPHRSTAIFGNNIAVGAFRESVLGETQQGVVYIFNSANGALVRTIQNPNVSGTANMDAFGSRLTINADYVAARAAGENSSIGVIYVFSTANGALVTTIANPNTTNQGTFGAPMKLTTSNKLVVSDHFVDSSSGRVYVYNAANGQLERTINNPNVFGTGAVDQFGLAMDADGDYIIAGAPGEDDPNASGRAYIFGLSNGTLLYTLNNPNVFGTGNNDSFGSTVAISGGYCVVAATGEGNANGAYVGAAYIYSVTNGALLATLTNPVANSLANNDYYGESLAMSDGYIIVGAARADSNTGTVNAGKVYVYR